MCLGSYCGKPHGVTATVAIQVHVTLHPLLPWLSDAAVGLELQQ